MHYWNFIQKTLNSTNTYLLLHFWKQFTNIKQSWNNQFTIRVDQTSHLRKSSLLSRSLSRREHNTKDSKKDVATPIHTRNDGNPKPTSNPKLQSKKSSIYRLIAHQHLTVITRQQSWSKTQQKKKKTIMKQSIYQSCWLFRQVTTNYKWTLVYNLLFRRQKYISKSFQPIQYVQIHVC